MRTAGIVLAGGSGVRYGGSLPKQFAQLRGIPLILHSVQKFGESLDHVVVVVHPEWIEYFQSDMSHGRDWIVVPGGETRQLSVYNGLKALRDYPVDVVAVHDGARPVFSRKLLDRVVRSALASHSGIPAIAVSDTLAKAATDRVDGYVERDRLFQIQTPQAFSFELLWEAHERAHKMGLTDSTDDSQLFHKAGYEVVLVDGERSNVKVTYPEDLRLCEKLMDFVESENGGEEGIE